PGEPLVPPLPWPVWPSAAVDIKAAVTMQAKPRMVMSRSPCSAHPKRILQLTLAHLRTPLDAAALRLRVKFLAGMSISLAGTGGRGFAASRSGLAGIAARHRTGAFAFPVCADVRLAFALLLAGAAQRFLMLGLAKIAPVARATLGSGCAGFLQGDGN